jgi:hypothetical protein
VSLVDGGVHVDELGIGDDAAHLVAQVVPDGQRRDAQRVERLAQLQQTSEMQGLHKRTARFDGCLVRVKA